MKTLFIILFTFLSATSFSQNRIKSWTVTNNSIYGTCPYEVCLTLELRYIGSPTGIPGTSVVVCHTITNGSSVSYTYPASPAPGIEVVLTGAQVNIGSNSYAVSVNPYYEYIDDQCSDLPSECHTIWHKMTVNQFSIAGICLL